MAGQENLWALPLVSDLQQTLTPAFLVQLFGSLKFFSALSRTKEKDTVLAMSESREVTSLSSLTPSMMYTHCVHCSSMITALLMVLQPDTSSCFQAKEPRLVLH